MKTVLVLHTPTWLLCTSTHEYVRATLICQRERRERCRISITTLHRVILTVVGFNRNTSRLPHLPTNSPVPSTLAATITAAVVFKSKMLCRCVSCLAPELPPAVAREQAQESSELGKEDAPESIPHQSACGGTEITAVHPVRVRSQK